MDQVPARSTQMNGAREQNTNVFNIKVNKTVSVFHKGKFSCMTHFFLQKLLQNSSFPGTTNSFI